MRLDAFVLIVPRDHRCGVEFDPDSPVHKRDQGEGDKVNVREQDCGVDFSHLWVGPILKTGKKRVCVVVIFIVHHVMMLHSLNC